MMFVPRGPICAAAGVWTAARPRAASARSLPNAFITVSPVYSVLLSFRLLSFPLGRGRLVCRPALVGTAHWIGGPSGKIVDVKAGPLRINQVGSGRTCKPRPAEPVCVVSFRVALVFIEPRRCLV